MANRNKRTEAEWHEDQIKLARLLVKGIYSLQQIADEINKGRPEAKHVTRQTIAANLKELREEWRKARVFNFNEVLTRQLTTLDTIEAEAWEAWERSKASKQVRRQGGKNKGVPVLDADQKVQFDKGGLIVRDKSEQDFSLTEVQQVGDPRFLEKIAWCVAERNKMFGLYRKLTDEELDRLIEEEFRRIAELQAQLKQPQQAPALTIEGKLLNA